MVTKIKTLPKHSVRRIAMTLCATSLLAACEPSLPPPPAGSKLTAETIATREAPEFLRVRHELLGRLLNTHGQTGGVHA